MRAFFLLVGMGLFLVASCVPGGADTVQPTQVLVPSTSTPIPTMTPEPTAVDLSDASSEASVPEMTVSPIPAQAHIVGLVVADLADLLAMDPFDIVVETVEEVTWSELSCDAELVEAWQDGLDGYQIVLLIDDSQHFYRTDRVDSFVNCDGAEDVEGSLILLDTNLNALVDIAQRNLAERLDLPIRRVFLVDAYPIVWPDSSLGCTQENSDLAPTPVAGYRIVLRVGNNEYAYHTNYRQVIFCSEADVRLPVTPEPTSTSTSN